MRTHAAITVLCAREEAQRRWNDPEFRPGSIADLGATVRFADAPGDRGTEIHVDLQPAGPIQKLTGRGTLATVKDELRRFKQHVETGEIPRSEGSPEGERAGRKLKQRPAQPPETAGVS